MFSHIMIGSNDIERSKIFYDNVLGVLGAKEGVFMPNLTGQTRYFYFLVNSWSYFSFFLKKSLRIDFQFF